MQLHCPLHFSVNDVARKVLEWGEYILLAGEHGKIVDATEILLVNSVVFRNNGYYTECNGEWIARSDVLVTTCAHN